MWRVGITALAIAAAAMPDGFTFKIGAPVASQDFHFKAAAFVFRTEGCGGSSKPDVSATAEGVIKEERRSVDLKVMAGSKTGIYGIYQGWPADGQWVVVLKGSCEGQIAGAIVPIGPKGFIRESSRFFPRAATKNEIDVSLKALSQGGNK